MKKTANKCDLCYGLSRRSGLRESLPTEALTLITEEDLETAMERKRAETARNTFKENHPQE